MYNHEEDVLKKVIQILQEKVFTYANQLGEEAATGVALSIRALEQLMEKDVVRKVSKTTEEFSEEHEEFITEFLDDCKKKDLYAFIFISDKKSDRKIDAGTMTFDTLVESLEYLMIKMPNFREKVLIAGGVPPQCMDCDGDNTPQIVRGPDSMPGLVVKMHPGKMPDELVNLLRGKLHEFKDFIESQAFDDENDEKDD